MTKTQNDMIEAHLLRHHKINPLQALKRYGCFRLAARIAELRNTYKITTKKVTRNGKTFAEYQLS